jgi:hypothetical protein
LLLESSSVSGENGVRRIPVRWQFYFTSLGTAMGGRESSEFSVQRFGFWFLVSGFWFLVLCNLRYLWINVVGQHDNPKLIHR